MATGKVDDNAQQSDEAFDFLCSLCKRKNRRIEAGTYCADCNDYYCTKCVKFHEEIPALSGHKVIKKGQAGTKSLPKAPTERCEKHRFKLVDFYCKRHNDVGCYTCMAVDHRACEDIYDIPEYVQSNDVFENIKNTRIELQEVAESIKKSISVCNRKLKRLIKSKQNALHSLHAHRDEINKKLDELEQNTIAIIEEKFTILKGNIKEELRVLKISQDEIKAAFDKFASSESNVSQLFVSSIKGKRYVDVESYSEDMSTSKNAIKVHFKKEEELLTLLDQMNALGRTFVPNELVVIRNRRQYNIRDTSDTKACNITSACVLEDGSTILADRENQNLKRLDGNFTIVDVCELQFEPWQICKVDKYTVAVISLCEGIFIIAAGKEMTVIDELATDDPCFGVASAKGNVYVTNTSSSVLVYSMSGMKLDEFSIDQAGEELFADLYGMAVSDTDMKIYVTDNKYGLVVLYMDGDLQGKYDCLELVLPRRICALENGSVLVCGGYNNCILQFTSEGEKLGNVMSSDTENNRISALCYDRRRNRLLVGRPDTDEIDIYDLW